MSLWRLLLLLAVYVAVFGLGWLLDALEVGGLLPVLLWVGAVCGLFHLGMSLFYNGLHQSLRNMRDGSH